MERINLSKLINENPHYHGNNNNLNDFLQGVMLRLISEKDPKNIFVYDKKAQSLSYWRENIWCIFRSAVGT